MFIIYEKKTEEALPLFQRIKKTQSLHINNNASQINLQENKKKIKEKSKNHLIKLLNSPILPVNIPLATSKMLKSSDFKSKSSLYLQRKPLENSENPENLKNSFIDTQESLLELSSIFYDNPLKTIKNVIDLEEKRQNTRKALFRKRYIKEYPIDYRPKALTTNKCIFYFF